MSAQIIHHPATLTRVQLHPPVKPININLALELIKDSVPIAANDTIASVVHLRLTTMRGTTPHKNDLEKMDITLESLEGRCRMARLRLLEKFLPSLVRRPTEMHIDTSYIDVHGFVRFTIILCKSGMFIPLKA